MDKKSARLKRALRQRSKIKQLGVNRLTVHRTSQHIYAQVMNEDGTATIASASTLDAEVKSSAKGTGNSAAATIVGSLVAKRALEAGVSDVAFDRSGFKYHGRVKALADAAREAGLKF
jgi:large subunit ribosomal protein L18